MIQASSGILLSERYQRILVETIDRAMDGCSGAVFLFGSRARGPVRPGSDIDLAVRLDSGSSATISSLREHLEQCALPYTADVVNLRECGPALECEVIRDGVVLWEH